MILFSKIILISLVASVTPQGILSVIQSVVPTKRPKPEDTNFTIVEAMAFDNIVPDVIDKAPGILAEIKYGNMSVNLGNFFIPQDVHDPPTVYWPSDPERHYALLMVDPDVPARNLAVLREWNHWLVGNIPGNNITAGQVIFEYIGAGPPPATGSHRYITLIYQQPWRIEFSEPYRKREQVNGRPGFNTRRFAKKYKLGHPIAGNYFQSNFNATAAANDLFSRLKVK